MNKRQARKAAYARAAGMLRDTFSMATPDFLETLYGADAEKVAAEVWEVVEMLERRSLE